MQLNVNPVVISVAHQPSITPINGDDYNVWCTDVLMLSMTNGFNPLISRVCGSVSLKTSFWYSLFDWKVNLIFVSYFINGITANFCPCLDSCAVEAWAEICCDLVLAIELCQNISSIKIVWKLIVEIDHWIVIWICLGKKSNIIENK